MQTPLHLPASDELRLDAAGLYGTLVSLIDQAVLLLDETGMILQASERVGQLTGWTQEQLVRTPFVRLLQPEERPRWQEKFLHARVAGRARDAFRIQRADGPPFHAECSFAQAANGHWLAVFRDISEQFAKEQELQRRNREAVALFEFARQARLSADITQLLDTIARNIPWILECHFSAVGIPDVTGETYRWAAVAGARSAETPLEGMQELASRLRTERAPVILSKEENIPLPAFLAGEALQSAVAFPLALKDTLLGILITGYRNVRDFADEETALSLKRCRYDRARVGQCPALPRRCRPGQPTEGAFLENHRGSGTGTDAYCTRAP